MIRVRLLSSHLISRVLPNTSIRVSASLSKDNNYELRAPIDGVTDADFQKGFEDCCEDHGATFSSEEDKQYHGRKYATGCFPSVDNKDIVDCIRKYGLDGDPDLTMEFILERSRNPVYPSRTEYRKDDPIYMAEVDEFMKVTQTYGPEYYIDENLGLMNVTQTYGPDYFINTTLGPPDVEPDAKLLSNNGDSDNE